MLRRALLLPVSIALLSACSDDAAVAPADAAEDTEYAEVWTGRPDDGVDTATDASADATDATADAAEETSADAADETSADATDGATDGATDAATDAVTDVASDAAPVPASARIHEVFTNPVSGGVATEFVEISAPPGTPLGTLRLRMIKKDGTVEKELDVADPGTPMKASGLWVVGHATLLAADKFYTTPEGWNVPDEGAVQLVLGAGAGATLVDVVGFGSAAASAPSTEPKKTVEGSPEPLPTTGKSIGRASVPGDTDDNASDFCPMTPSPGAANGACL